jgi:spore germination protein
MDILKKTLPFLSYLSIFGYRFLENASIEEINDTAIIKMAKDYGVAPIMVLSTFNLQGVGSVETIYQVFGSEELSDRLINNILSILKEKGYYGFNFTYYFYNAENKSIYVNFTHKLTKRLNQEGFFVSITLTQNIVFHKMRLLIKN